MVKKKETKKEIEELKSEKNNMFTRNLIQNSRIKQIIDKIECMDYYCLNEAEEDLRKLLEGDE